MALFSALTAAIGGTAAGATAGAAGGAAAGISGAVGAIGTIGGLAGTVMQMKGAREAAEGAKTAEDIRKAQQDIEAVRQRRQIIRQGLIARSEALSNATAQGAQGGSGLAGGIAQTVNSTGQQITNVNQSQDLGNQMFRANARISAGQTTQSVGSGISSLAGSLVKSQEQIGRLGAYAIG